MIWSIPKAIAIGTWDLLPFNWRNEIVMHELRKSEEKAVVPMAKTKTNGGT